MSHIFSCTITQSPEEFFSQFKKECTRRINNEEELTAAFLAFDLDNLEVVKMLLDPVYWNAINQSTGNQIALFYINPKDLIEKKYKSGLDSSEKRRTSIILPTSNKMETFIPMEVSNIESINPYIQYLLDQLKYDKYTKPKYPFLIFVKIKEQEITDNFAVELIYKNKIDVDESVACNELLRIIKNITSQLQYIKRDSNPNKDTIFNLVKSATRDSNIFDFLTFLGGRALDVIIGKI